MNDPITFIPLDHLLIDDDLFIPSSKILAESMHHDINMGTLTLTLIVRTLHTEYKTDQK